MGIPIYEIDEILDGKIKQARREEDVQFFSTRPYFLNSATTLFTHSSPGLRPG